MPAAQSQCPQRAMDGRVGVGGGKSPCGLGLKPLKLLVELGVRYQAFRSPAAAGLAPIVFAKPETRKKKQKNKQTANTQSSAGPALLTKHPLWSRTRMTPHEDMPTRTQRITRYVYPKRKGGQLA